ncbi:fungal-specific transcription factor domain-containing protein [Xylariales sp. AK1849]|nr:fungal-specific transcription factor domain-containing protein [Xylariales sp. AK1849]
MSNHEDDGDDRKKTKVTPPNSDPQPTPPPRKRRRIVISCADCHKRKQKCDRKLPCTNCVSRGKQSSCRYETGTPLAEDQQRKGLAAHGERPPIAETLENIPIKPADFGYSNSGSSSTLGFLKKIESVGAGKSLSSVREEVQETDHFGSRERYKSLVRHLPARTFVEKLVDIYFDQFNWMYYGLDEAIFHEYLEQWYNLPFHLLSSAGPQGIEPALRSFPALLFQILATSLLAVYDEEDENFASLKYAGNMTFEDLALEYSETGVALLTLLGKRQMTVSTALAGWVRAAFLKYTGQVTEAWHQVGTAIRDAQEIGLHRDQFDPAPDPADNTETALEALWTAQIRRKVWMTLVSWDLHTGAVLGRPTSVDHRTLKRTAPVDAPIPKDRRKTPIFPRGENDPPTPLTRALWSYEMIRPLRDILDLEKEGPFPKDFSKVEKLHRELLELQERTPPYFRLENPDTRFDHLPKCGWLPQVRPTLPQLLAFNFMALHRPYIFTRSSSRHEALKASLYMLEAQRIHFQGLSPQQYKTFSLFFGTFDAIVMTASIYILFPKEHPELLRDCLQHFQWGVERFEAMSGRNRLAGAALGVLNAIYIRLKKAIGHGFLNRACPQSFTCEGSHEEQRDDGNSNGEAANLDGSDTQMSASIEPSPNNDDTSHNHNLPLASASGCSILPPSDQGTNPTTTSASTVLTPGTDIFTTPDWSFPTGFDFSSLPPMYPMGDVAYNDLTGIKDGGLMASNTVTVPASSQWSSTVITTDATMAGLRGLGSNVGAVDGSNQDVPYSFGGEFGNDTIWNLLNQFPPY